MPQSHLNLLSKCSDAQLLQICARRRVPVPQNWEEGAEGRTRLLKTMVHHLEDHKRLTDTLADLDGTSLVALKAFSGTGTLPAEPQLARLAELGLMLPDGEGWAVAPRVADALDDFDESALAFQTSGITLPEGRPYGFALALNAVLLRCTSGLRVLKGGLPAKKELSQLLRGNALIRDERDATLAFALLHRLGLLWSRENRVDTLLPAVFAHPPRWVAERAFAKLLEDDLKLWNLPPAEDRRFLLQHLLERKGQVLATDGFLAFLQTLHPLDARRTREVFLPFLGRMGIITHDEGLRHLSLTIHGEALAQEYLLRDHRGTESHWTPLMRQDPLVIQPTLEALTPMAQDLHRLLLLAQVGEVETLDAVLTLRIGHDTLVRALDSGIGLDEIRQRLGAGGTHGLPQPLTQLLEDLGQRLGEVEVEQGVRLVRARTPQLAAELRLRPELAGLGLEPISDTVMSAEGPGNAFALLKQAGFLPKPGRFLPVSLDADESLYLWALAGLAFIDEKGMNHHLEPVRQMIHGALQKIQAEDPNLHQEILRRVPMLSLGSVPQAQEETTRILEYAARFNLMVELSYLPLAAHRSQQRRVTPQGIDAEHLRGFCHLHQEEMSFRLSRIMGVRLLNEKGWTPSLNTQAG